MLNECAYECTMQSRWKETTQRYLSNMLVKNIELQADVLSGKYKVSPTVDFILNERGHIRQIEAPVVRDRIVQKTLMKNVLTPSIRPVLIYDNYASLTDRGTSFARKRLEVMLHRYIRKHGTDGYILLIDVKKYFGNIDHEILKKLIEPRIQGEPQDVKDLIHYMIDTSSKTEKGLNLGSECPQIFAVYYLNPIDQFVKVVKGVKYYEGTWTTYSSSDSLKQNCHPYSTRSAASSHCYVSKSTIRKRISSNCLTALHGCKSSTISQKLVAY